MRRSLRGPYLFVSAAERYVMRDREPTLPAELGRIHLAVVRPPGPKQPFFREFRGLGWNAACGRQVSIVLPDLFDEDAADACPACVERWRMWMFTDEAPDWMNLTY